MSKGSHAPVSDLLTVNEAAAYLKCSREFLWKLRKKGSIETVYAGNKVLLPKSSIDNFLQLKLDVHKMEVELVNSVHASIEYAFANGSFTTIPKETIDILTEAAKCYIQEKKEVANA